VGLDDTGRREAEAMARVLADRQPARLVSSDLARARETAAFLEKETGLTAVEDARLREYDLGERTGLTREEFGARVGDDAVGWSDPHGHVMVPGAESHEDVAARIVPALREVLDALRPAEMALVVLHGAALRVGLVGLLDWPIETAAAIESMDNCAWAELAEHDAGRLRLSSYNTRVGR
jgi:probable phosphoglycerate mutase